MELDETFDIRRGLVNDDFIHCRETILCEKLIRPILDKGGYPKKIAYSFRYYTTENKLVAYDFLGHDHHGNPIYTESKPESEHESLIRRRLNIPA